MKITHIPQDLADRLPLGQIVLLTSPETGITYTDCERIERISTLGKGTGKPCVITSLIVDAPELWGCFAYRKKDQILVADWRGLVELLSIIWEVSLEDLDGQVTSRYMKYKSGKSHPAIFPVAATNHPAGHMTANTNGQTLLDLDSFDDYDDFDYGLTLGFITPTDASVTRDLSKAINDIIGWNLDYSKEKINKLFDDLMENKREYHVELSCKKEKVRFDSRRKFKLKHCNLYLVDNKGDRYLIEDIGVDGKKVGPSEKAAYLAFLFFKDGVILDGRHKNEEFRRIYQTIYSSMPGRNPVTASPEDLMFRQKASNAIGLRVA